MAGKEPRVVWRPLAGRPLTQRTSGVWPAGRSSHPAAPHFAELAADVLTREPPATPHGDDGAPAVTELPRPWAVVYDEAASRW